MTDMNTKQISFRVSNDFHAEIKIAAIRRNISMNLWIFRALYQALKKEGLINEAGQQASYIRPDIGE